MTKNAGKYVEYVPAISPDLSRAQRRVLKSFLLTKRLEGCSIGTLQGYNGTITAMLIGIHKPVDRINTVDLRNFIYNYQLEKKVTNRTSDNMRLTYSSFFNYLEEEDFISKNPTRKIHKIKYERVVHIPFTEEEIVKIKDACKSLRDRAMIDFLNSSGVRVSELSGLDITDIDLDKREGYVYGKGSKERKVYFDAATKIHLEKYLLKRKEKNPALFVNTKEPYDRLTKTGIEYAVKVLGERADVQKCHPHRFRRTLATRLIDRGVPIEQVQKILGHTKIDTTLIYAQVNDSNVKMNHTKFA